MKRIVSLFTVMMLCGVLSFAQTRTVTGQVRTPGGDPVPYATVTESGTSNATTADANGNYSIKVGNSARLTFTAAGFAAQTITPTGNTASVSLSGTGGLTEVVVTTSLGQVRQKASLGYSTAQVRSTELTQSRPTNLQNGLTGKVSGLNVLTVNNGVFADTRLTLRGIRSLTGNNQPMLILDGVPLSLGYINSINPNDIAEVSILKSAAATAVYGPDGVNGALVVTTKRGSRTKPLISVSHATQIEKVSYMPKNQTTFGGGYNQNPITGEGEFESIEQQSWGPAFDGSIRQLGQDGPNGEKMMIPYANLPNNRRNFFNTGVTNQTDVSFSTGDFYMSAQNVHIDGVMPGDVNNRRSLAIRAEKEYNKFKAIFNVRYTQGKYDATTSGTTVYYGVTGAPANVPLSNFKNWRTDYFSSPNGYFTPYLDNNGKTPYFAKDNNREVGRSGDLIGNIELNYKALSWLNFVYRLAGTQQSSDADQTRGAFAYSAYHGTLRDHASLNITSAITNFNSYNSRLTSEFFANFNKKFDKFGVNGTLGHTFRESRTRNLSAGSNNLGTSTFLSINARLGEPAVGITNSKQRLERYFGRVGFDYNNMVFVEAAGSYDRNSVLVPKSGIVDNKKIGKFYPSASASVLLHEIIPGLKDNKTLNFAKIRASISKTANAAIGPYSNETAFGTGLFFPYGSTPGYTIGGTTYPSEGLDFEIVNSKDVGIELGFLNNKINFEATYFTQNNDDQILNIQLSNTTGFTSRLANAGSFTNKGVELDLKLTPLAKIKNITIDLKVNYSYITNEITSLADGVNELGIGNYLYAIVGKPAYTFKLTDYVRDPNGHVIVSPTTGMPTVNNNLTAFGKSMPDNILGLNLMVNWKGLSFSAVGEYRTGNQFVADQLGQFLDDNGVSLRSAQNGRRAFIFPNSVIETSPGKFETNTTVYTQNYGRLFWNTDLNTSVITNYLASGAFWKLREMSLSYTLPAKWFKGNTLKGIDVALTGRNLFMWVPDSNVWTDPEFSNTTGNAVGRSTAAQLPPTRIFGANATFKF